MTINPTGNDRIDTATAEIAVALRDGSPSYRDEHYYEEAMRLRDEILAGAAELAARPPMRKAVVTKSRPNGNPDGRTVSVYLPTNYRVTGETETEVIIEGRDNAGWTLDDYVIPRLASGMLYAKEVQS